MKDKDFIDLQDELREIAVFAEGTGLETPGMLIEQDMRHLERVAMFDEVNDAEGL